MCPKSTRKSQNSRFLLISFEIVVLTVGVSSSFLQSKTQHYFSVDVSVLFLFLLNVCTMSIVSMFRLGRLKVRIRQKTGNNIVNPNVSLISFSSSGGRSELFLLPFF